MNTKGKRVYIAWLPFDYYGMHMLGVYTTRARAKERCEKHCEENGHNKMSEYIVHSYAMNEAQKGNY